MSRQRKPSTAWEFWQQAAASLDAVNAEMQRLATFVAQERVIAIPSCAVRDIRRNLHAFEEKFDLLVREQKRTAAIRCQ